MYDVVVIGAGQAGLAMGYFLQKQQMNYLILDKGSQVGEVWKNRYDSLKLFTPRMFNALPGLPLLGDNHGLPTKDEMAAYLNQYAEVFHLSIKFNCEVIQVTKENEIFTIVTNEGELISKAIVVATGPFQKPWIPEVSYHLSDEILQLHSSEYKNPTQLKKGDVLVVGGGNSGAQIAVELSRQITTYLAVSQPLRYLPLFLCGKSIFWWFKKAGILNASNTSLIGKLIQKKGDPIFGKELKRMILNGTITVKGRVVSIEKDLIEFNKGASVKVQNIIWATGFKSDYHWLKITNSINHNRQVEHDRGVSPVKGLYFLGLPWQTRRGSALLQGVGEDARFIMNHISWERV
ncbi:putative flavoprotein involved in K+ transport [Bacillus pakistanensis]|uniref:Flavoprotein involved in K+ transport n=1 Tax=Rossellomorea pakistanensis TaxID=992288 RepID=A0ABS2N6Z6_9BACI|nr:NAD(P)/FAD-dependent oxidoreductase [Bacillus pakistanensis]MBM7583625.1 putative flavoprotein involved in K+ transport [Bacillus pakistanensis]